MLTTIRRLMVPGLALACIVIAMGGNLLEKWLVVGAVVPEEVASEIYGSDCPLQTVGWNNNPTCPTSQANTCSGFSTSCTSYLCGWQCIQNQPAPNGTKGKYHYYNDVIDCDKTITYPCMTGTFYNCYCNYGMPSPVKFLTYSGPLLCFIDS